jgi:hypothetical protein
VRGRIKKVKMGNRIDRMMIILEMLSKNNLAQFLPFSIK